MVFFSSSRRALHRPRETTQELCRRLGRTPHRYLSDSDKTAAKILRAKRQRKLQDALMMTTNTTTATKGLHRGKNKKKMMNPYVIDRKYPIGQYWPYPAEVHHGVHGHGVIVDGSAAGLSYVPYDNWEYGHWNPEDFEKFAGVGGAGAGAGINGGFAEGQLEWLDWEEFLYWCWVQGMDPEDVLGGGGEW